MRLLFAAYDQAIQSPFGNYWAWMSPEVPKELPDRVRSQVIQHDPCLKPNSLARDDLHGGCVALDSHWCAFYRHYNGGRDRQERPEHGILLIGFANRAEAMRQDCSQLLDYGLFDEWAGQQPLTACPPRPNTAGDGDSDSAPISSTMLERSSEVKDSESVTDAPIRSESISRWNECLRFGVSTGFHWRIKRENGAWSADVESLPATHSQTSRIGEVERVPKFTSEKIRTTRLADPKRELGRWPLFSATRFALGLAFVAGSFVGWTVHGLLGFGMSVTPGIDIEAAQRWAETYHSDDTGKQIPRAELQRRLRSDDWSETAHNHDSGSESKQAQ